jgi:hypothetical protein
MSGGGTDLMSGGGLSIGSIGRGKSGFGFGGCSIMPKCVQQRCLSSHQLQSAASVGSFSHQLQSSASVGSFSFRLRLPTETAD